MLLNSTSRNRVSDITSCPNCKTSNVIKNGTTKNKKQQYQCKNCNKRFISSYSYNAYFPETNKNIVLLTKEELGIRSTSRILKISTTTLLKRIRTIAQMAEPPRIVKGKTYEIDEMRTYVKRKDKLIWIVYALERETKNIVSFNVGNRSNKTLNAVITTVQLSNPLAIYTDRLKHYRYLVDQKIHKTKRYGTNYIERKNLTLRTHIRRLNRRTICYSKSKTI